MSVKFSVGVSDVEEDRLLLEERRQSAEWLGRVGDDELEDRPPGWPLSPPACDEDTDADPEPDQPPWAW
jgi:hypothetical protein